MHSRSVTGTRPGRRRDVARSGPARWVATLVFFVLLVLFPDSVEAGNDRSSSGRRTRRARTRAGGRSPPPQRLEFMGFPVEELALAPTGPPETALQRLADMFAYTPARFVATQNGQQPQDRGYHRFKSMPVGDDLKALLLESVQLDLTRQAEARAGAQRLAIRDAATVRLQTVPDRALSLTRARAAISQIIAADLCAFPKPGPHESRTGQQPIYEYFSGDPASADYIAELLQRYQPDIEERADILCRSWTTNGYVPPSWVLNPAGTPGSLPQRFRQYLPEEVLNRLDALPPWEGPSARGPPPPAEYVQLSQPTNTLHAPPYKPDSPWGHWGFDPAIFEFFFSDPIIDDKPPVSLGRRGWVASPWA